VPSRVREDVPDGLRRLRLLPVPDRGLLEGAIRPAPAGFRLGLKAPEGITVSTWPKHARYGSRAGADNASFLDPAPFAQYFTRRLEPYGDRVGPLIFEFGTFNKQTFPTPADFYARLGPFLDALPGGFKYAIETRNEEYLTPDYCDILSRRNIAHCFNAWTRMPPLDEQAQIDDAYTADFTVVRGLLRPGSGYEDAVDTLQPYDRIQEPHERSRQGVVDIASRIIDRKYEAYIFVNNRLEGNAPSTIDAVVEQLG
jgi:uncharacterized protein YecE (DUF72 family)